MSRWSYIKDGKKVARFQATVNVDIPDSWFDYCHHADLFGHGYCGYWMYGVAHDDERGWLVYETSGEGNPSDELCEEAIELWEARKWDHLPDGFMVFTDAVMAQAYQIAVRKFGTKWEEEGDACTYDVIVQEALLGEVRYG